LPEWVAKNDDDYIAVAKKMAKDRNALLELKLGLRERLVKCPAWDVVAHTRALEQTLLSTQKA
jgi:predicted O-linked N-acetylglucosamine transferase (SPINDLY family)